MNESFLKTYEYIKSLVDPCQPLRENIFSTDKLNENNILECIYQHFYIPKTKQAEIVIDMQLEDAECIKRYSQEGHTFYLNTDKGKNDQELYFIEISTRNNNQLRTIDRFSPDRVCLVIMRDIYQINASFDKNLTEFRHATTTINERYDMLLFMMQWSSETGKEI